MRVCRGNGVPPTGGSRGVGTDSSRKRPAVAMSTGPRSTVILSSISSPLQFDVRVTPEDVGAARLLADDSPASLYRRVFRQVGDLIDRRRPPIVRRG